MCQQQYFEDIDFQNKVFKLFSRKNEMTTRKECYLLMGAGGHGCLLTLSTKMRLKKF